MGCSETSVNNYQSTPHNIPEEHFINDFNILNFTDFFQFKYCALLRTYSTTEFHYLLSEEKYVK
jgi:hypothetical protein